MAKARTLVGLDVHATKIVAAVLDAETGELQCFTLSGDVSEAAGLCAGLPRPVRATYEAGPTGYGLARELARRGVQCVVAAPSKIPRAAGDRVKTDRRDAEHLVRLLLAGKLHAVRVPGPEEEALRDLVRAREAVRADLMRCRHRLSKLLLCHGIRFDDGQAWTQRHRGWLAEVTLDWPAAQATMLDAQGAIDALAHRRDALDREIVALIPTSPWAGQVARLRCLRGIDTLTAVGLCSEIGDFERFAKAEQLMSYAGWSRRRQRPVRSAGSARSPRPAPGTPAGCSSRQRGTTDRDPGSAKRSPIATTASPPKRSRSPGAPSSACIAPGRAWSSAPSAARSSPSPSHESSPASAGRSPASNELTAEHPIPSAGSVAARQRAGNPRQRYEQPAPKGGWPRPILDSGSPRRINGPAVANPRMISLTARRAQHCRTATHPADHTPEPEERRRAKSPTPA